MAGERVCRAASYLLARINWLWCRIAVSGVLQANCMEDIESVSRGDSTFIKLSKLEQISIKDLTMIEHFIVLSYDRTCSYNIIGKCCKYLFMQVNHNDWQLLTRSRFLAATCLQVDTTIIHLVMLHDAWKTGDQRGRLGVGQWMTSVSSTKFERYLKHTKNWKTVLFKSFGSVAIVHARLTMFHLQIFVIASDNVKTKFQQHLFKGFHYFLATLTIY